MAEQTTLPMTQDPPRIHCPKPTGLHYEGRDNAGKPIIIDAAEIGPHRYEIMALRPGGEELEQYTVHNLDVARCIYDDMIRDYTQTPKALPPLTGKYAKLRDDLRKVHKIGLSAAEMVEDGGTCNHDAPALHLPMWKRALVEQACKEAGGGCFFWRCFGANMCVVCLPTPGQAYKQETAAEAMTKALSDLGYDALCYQQMD